MKPRSDVIICDAALNGMPLFRPYSFYGGQTGRVNGTPPQPTGTDGIAGKAIPLGAMPGGYSISATRPSNVCVEGGRDVGLPATARGTELVCENCDCHGRIN